MGQNSTRSPINKQFFNKYYTETMSNQFIPFSKSFGFRKMSIKSVSSQNIVKLFPSDMDQIQIEKQKHKNIKKKQFPTSTYPYSCIGLLIVIFKERCLYGTGSLIAKNIVLTTASNICNKDSEQKPSKILFALGININCGDIYLIKNQTHIPQKYFQESEGSHRYNFALLTIDRQENCGENYENVAIDQYLSENPGLVYGYLGVNTHFQGSQNIYIYGYSMRSLETDQISIALRGEKIDKLLCKHGSIGYKMDSEDSESGSPILIRRNEYYHLVGIHICGKKGLGTGLQFDENIQRKVNSWITCPEGTLDISNNSLDSKTFDMFTRLPWNNLVNLNLDNNNLMCTGMIVLTKITLPTLRELHICNNNIVKFQFQPTAIKNLQIFHISKNYINDASAISELSLIRVLQFSQNKLQSMEVFIQLKYLQRLYLNGNRIPKIPHSIQKLTQLRKIQLSRNQIQTIPEQFLKLKYLSMLSIDKNRGKFKNDEIKINLQQMNIQVIF